MNQRPEYRALFESALGVAARKGNWFPFKWTTLFYLYQAAKDAEFTERMQSRYGADPNLPTLAELIDFLFELAIAMYGPMLPFGGKYARVLKDLVLQFLGELLVPPTLVYRKA